jgi:hypothetical protein
MGGLALRLRGWGGLIWFWWWRRGQGVWRNRVTYSEEKIFSPFSFTFDHPFCPVHSCSMFFDLPFIFMVVLREYEAGKNFASDSTNIKPNEKSRLKPATETPPEPKNGFVRIVSEENGLISQSTIKNP